MFLFNIKEYAQKAIVKDGFNPCFNGCSSSTQNPPILILIILSFNPCFNGCSSSTGAGGEWTRKEGLVSILVLMDVPLQREYLFLSFI